MYILSYKQLEILVYLIQCCSCFSVLNMFTMDTYKNIKVYICDV